MERNQKIAIGSLVAFTALAVFLAFQSDSIAVSMRDGDFWTALLYSYVLNPSNILIILSVVLLNRDKVFQAILASFLIIFAFSAVSFPHLVGSDGLPLEANAYGSTDTIVIRQLNELGVAHPVSWFLYYIIGPILALLLALYLLGYKAFVKKFVGGGG